MDKKNPSETVDRDKLIKEAIEHLAILEDRYTVNPKIREYFSYIILILQEDFWAVLIQSATIKGTKKLLKILKSRHPAWFTM